MIFSAPMIKALLANRKSQTRRIIKSPRWAPMDLDDADGREAALKRCPHGNIGEHLWVRETFVTGTMNGGDRRWVRYRATDAAEVPEETKWTTPIYMPRWASRLNLKITNRQIQRVQDIQDWEVRCEGLEVGADGYSMRVPGLDSAFTGPKMAFAIGWDHINGSGAWERNDWVWVISFTTIPLAATPEV